jgi:hypothetical protein
MYNYMGRELSTGRPDRIYSIYFNAQGEKGQLLNFDPVYVITTVSLICHHCHERMGYDGDLATLSGHRARCGWLPDLSTGGRFLDAMVPVCG